MFDKILIANRGEIACRVIRTASVAWASRPSRSYSDADARAPHVEMADEAVQPGAAARRPKATCDADADPRLRAKETGAEAVHPGYGFLSERESLRARLLKPTTISPSSDRRRARSRRWATRSSRRSWRKAAGVNGRAGLSSARSPAPTTQVEDCGRASAIR